MDKEFKTKGAFKDFINLSLKQMKLGNYYPGTPGFDFLHSLYKRHPNYNANIEYFQLSPLQYGGEEISRVFNNKIDIFSKHSCINEKLKSDDAKMKAMLRERIIPQLSDYDKLTFCEKCNATTDLQIDHKLPFSKILKSFPFSIEIEYDEGQQQRVFKNEDIVNQFLEHHRQHATYRTLCRMCNIQAYHKEDY
jgi:hypothetical protein